MKPIFLFNQTIMILDLTILEIILLSLLYLLSAGFIAVALSVADDLNPVFERIMNYALFVPVANQIVALIVCYVFFQNLILNGTSKTEGSRSSKR